MQPRFKWLVFAALIFASSTVSSEIISTEKTYDELLRMQDISVLDSGLFGEQIKLKDGVTHFSQTDVSLQTKSKLLVEFSRHTPRQKQGLDREQMPLGAGWEIDIPYMMGTYDTRRGWDASGSQLRCSGASLRPSETIGPAPYYYTRLMSADMYWNGIYINIPHQGFESLLKLRSEHTIPTDRADYIGSTISSWRVGCLPSIKNGSGEGFFVKLPNGLKYYFNWMATRNASDVLASEYYRDANGDGTDPTGLLVPTADVFLYATKVEDQYGNYLIYEFDDVNKHRLKSIYSNDGVRIDVAYDSYGKVSTVRSADRVWSYNYLDSYFGRKLSEVVLPDKSTWSFPAGSAYHNGAMWWYMVPARLPGGFYMNSCAQDATGFRTIDGENKVETTTITMKHPSGAVGEFTMRSLVHGSDNTPGGCGLFGVSSSDFWFGSYGVPNAYMARSLVSKRISGAGITSGTWRYSYYPQWSFQQDCTTKECTSRTVENRPDGSTAEYIFGNSYSDNIGELLITTVSSAGKVSEKTIYQRAADSQVYPQTAGDLIAKGNPLTAKFRPVSRVQIQRNGKVFIREIDAFDQFARPVRVVKRSEPSM